MPTYESRQEFHQRHSVKGEPIRDGGQWLYPDGSTLSVFAPGGIGEQRDPPRDSEPDGRHRRWQLIARYHELRHDQVNESYRELGQRLLTHCRQAQALGSGDIPPESELL